MSNNRIRLLVVLGVLVPGATVILPTSDRLTVPVARPTGGSFEERVARYSRLRRDLADHLQTGVSSAEAAADERFRYQLAVAIRNARHDARPGDIFGLDTAAGIALAVRSDMAARDGPDLEDVLADVPVSNVRVNDFYPQQAPLATMPALLLMKLVPLPAELQYRFLDDALILLDIETDLIVDAIPGVLKGS